MSADARPARQRVRLLRRELLGFGAALLEDLFEAGFAQEAHVDARRAVDVRAAGRCAPSPSVISSTRPLAMWTAATSGRDSGATSFGR